MLRVMAAERALEYCYKAIESLEETRMYYVERLARWTADVAAWIPGRDFRYDGYCDCNSKGMAELKTENFELYKKFIKAGKGIPYYKSYDEGGVAITKIALRNTIRGVDYLRRRIEDYERAADAMAQQDSSVPEAYSWDKFKAPTSLKPEFNAEHWAGVKEMSWRKMIEIQRGASNWTTKMLFVTLTTIRNKQANCEFSKDYSFWSQGLIFKELYARTENASYWDQYQDMRAAWLSIQKTPVKAKVPEVDELELNLNVYEMPNYSLSEDELIDAIDRR